MQKGSVAGVDVESLLQWGAPCQVRSRGRLATVRAGVPTPAFWAAWRAGKDALKAAGVSVRRADDGEWQVSLWQDAGAGSGGGDAGEPAAEAGRATPESRPGVFCAKPAPARDASPPPAAGAAGSGVVGTATLDSVRWSPEQEAVLEWYSSGSGNLVVRARAGTGKTFTTKAGLDRAPEERKLYLVFNKRNQKEAKDKITDPRVDVLTLHALGLRYVQAQWPGSKPDAEVEDDRVRQVCRDIPDEVCAAVKRLVSAAKNAFAAPTLDQLVDLADLKDVECPGYEPEENGGWVARKLAETALAAMEAAKVRDPQRRVSFDDMVWLPVACGWVRAWYDLVVVDEAQDMNWLQLATACGARAAGGRVCVVGDDRQAIYGFRGAATDGMDATKARLAAAELGLTVTRRCPKRVVEMAREIVPDFKAAPDAPDGTVEASTTELMLAGARAGDAVLSRVNAPLMSACLKLLRRGTPARIEGRDLGRALLAQVDKMRPKSVPDFLRRVESWRQRQVKRALDSRHPEEKCAAANDQADMLEAVAEGAASVSEVRDRLSRLFADSDKDPSAAVVLSSVHRAKGLEWDRVWLLEETFQRRRPAGAKPPTPAQAREEQNIRYVALTRAKRHLLLVDDRRGPASREAGRGERTDSGRP